MPNQNDGGDLIQFPPANSPIGAALRGLPVIGGGEDPLAAQLRAAVFEAHNHRPIKVKTNEKGEIIEDRPKPAELVLQPFPDGVLLKATPNKAKAETGTWLICDANGLNVALAIDENIADIICKGVHMFYESAQAHIKEAEAAALAKNPPVGAEGALGPDDGGLTRPNVVNERATLD